MKGRLDQARRLDDAEGVEVPSVGGQGDLAVAIEVDHALVHGAPDHLALPFALSSAWDTEQARVVDDRLDAQHEGELVVHLEPVLAFEMVGQALGAGGCEAGSAAADGQAEAGAVLQTTQDADEALVDGLAARESLNEVVFADGTVEMDEGVVGLFGQVTSMVDDALGLPVGPGHEVVPADAGRVIDEVFEALAVTQQSQVAFEDDAVKTR